MHTKKARKLSRALMIIRDSYDAKANGLPYSKSKPAFAFQYIESQYKYIDKRSDDIEREFLFSCFDALEELKIEGDFAKIACFANAIHRVPYLFCGEETWDDGFKEQYILPFCRLYGNEWFEELLPMRLPKKTGGQKASRTVYRYNEPNLTSLPVYFCFRMLFPLIILPILFGGMLYVRISAYTETDHGERYEITATACTYENEGAYDYLSITCKEFDAPFEITRFFQYSDRTEELIARCEAGEPLVAYAKYKESNRYDPYYEVIQLEGPDGTVYRSYEHTNQTDRYLVWFLAIVAIVIFVPFFLLFLMMLIVACNRQRFLSHPHFVKFCFPNYSLSLDKRL